MCSNTDRDGLNSVHLLRESKKYAHRSHMMTRTIPKLRRQNIAGHRSAGHDHIEETRVVPVTDTFTHCGRERTFQLSATYNSELSYRSVPLRIRGANRCNRSIVAAVRVDSSKRGFEGLGAGGNCCTCCATAETFEMTNVWLSIGWLSKCVRGDIYDLLQRNFVIVILYAASTPPYMHRRVPT